MAVTQKYVVKGLAEAAQQNQAQWKDPVPLGNPCLGSGGVRASIGETVDRLRRSRIFLESIRDAILGPRPEAPGPSRPDPQSIQGALGECLELAAQVEGLSEEIGNLL